MKYRYLFFILCGIVFFRDNAYAQLVSDNAFLQGQYLEVAVSPNGSWGNTVTLPAGYHSHPGGAGTSYTDPVTHGTYTGNDIDFSYDAEHDGWTAGNPTGTPCCFYGPYFMPGTPFNGWAMEVNGSRSDAFFTTAGAGGTPYGFWQQNAALNDLSGTVVSYSYVPGCPGVAESYKTGVWQGTAGPGGGLKIVTTNWLDTLASWVVVNAIFTNTTATTMTGLYYFVTGDPDNDEVTTGGSFPTNNHITYSNDALHRSLVWGRPPSLHQDAFSSLSTKDCRAKPLIYADWSSYPAHSTTAGVDELDQIYAGTAAYLGATYYGAGATTLDQDIAYGLVFDVGDLAPGASAFVTYAWGFNDTTAVDSAFQQPKLIVNCAAVATTASNYATVNPCPSATVRIQYGYWGTTTWNWSPSIGLATTSGLNNTITVSALPGNTTYTITPSDTSSCNHFPSFYLTVIACFYATNNGPICAGDTLKLVAHGDSTGATYVWRGPGIGGPVVGTGQFLDIFPTTYADTGTFYVIKTQGGSNDTVSTHVVFKPLPVVTPGSNAPICSGSTLNLTSTPDSTGETFTWTGPNGFTSVLENPSVTTTIVSDSGTYKVVTTFNGCIDSNTIYVVIDSTPPVPSISSNSPVCSGDTLLLTSGDADPDLIYGWAGPAGFTSVLLDPSITPVTTAASGTYTVTVTQGMCSSSATTVVVINPTPPAPMLSSNSPVCSGTSLFLYATSTAGSTYGWVGPNGFSSTVQNPTITPATTLATGLYSVVATLNGCPSAVDTISAIVDSTPATPTAWSNSPGAPSICAGDSLFLWSSDPTAGVTFNWAGPNAFTSSLQNTGIPDVTIAANGQYTVTVTSGMCSNFVETAVSVTAIPALSATSNSPVCTGDTLFLQAIAPPGATFSWSGPYTFSSGSPNPVRDSVTLEYAGPYVVTAFLNGCSATVGDTVVIHQTPAPPWVTWLTYCQFYDDAPVMAAGENILWYPTDATNGIGVSTPPLPPTARDTVIWYYLTQTVDGCISAMDSMKVSVYPKPLVTLRGDTAICPHDSVLLNAIDTDLAATYKWTPSLYLTATTGPSVTSWAETDIHYTVVASNQYGCTDTAVVAISVYPGAVITIGTDSVLLYPGQVYQIDPTTNCTSFAWMPPGGLSGAYISNPVASPLISTKYVVTGTTENGCVARDSINVYVDQQSVLGVPNAFTPGNGPDNVFRIILNGEATLKYFRVWDRWGVLVFETTDITQGWDGTYKGVPQPFGVYVYQIEAVTSTEVNFEKHGNVTLIR